MKIKCGQGVVELLAQTCQLRWMEEGEHGWLHRAERPIVPIRYMQNGKASTYAQVLHQSLPEVTISNLKQLTVDIPFVVLALTSDSAYAISRLKAWLLLQAIEHNEAVDKAGAEGSTSGGYLLMLDYICWAHVLTSLVLHTFKYRLLIPRVYATSFIH